MGSISNHRTRWLPALGFILMVSGSCAAKAPPQHRPDAFQDAGDGQRHGFLDFLKWRWQRLWQKWPAPKDYRFPLAENDPAFLRANTGNTTVTWIGHATLLLQLAGKNILTDPVFSERASPVQWAGPKRVVAPGLCLEALPPIDLVIISHDHYDALDKETVLKLYRRQNGDATVFFVPLGLKAWFQGLGIANVVELDWWETHRQDGLQLTAVPVRHWSQRNPFFTDNALWSGWALRSGQFRFFFCGDSGYGPHFKEIGARLGPFDLAAIPIGAYEPRWFMQRHHLNPEEALQTHMDLKAKMSVAIHWGTFILTDEPLDEPPRRIQAALAQKGAAAPDFRVIKHGETLVLD